MASYGVPSSRALLPGGKNRHRCGRMAKRRSPLRRGIDFGTTRTVVAVCDRGNYPVVSFTDETGDAVEAFPSVVAEKEGALRFGFEAERRGADQEWTIVQSFKSLLSIPPPDELPP